MNFDIPQPNESEQREQAWQAKLAAVAERQDKAGGEMDPHIIEPVVALNMHGIATSQSCEGHLDHGPAVPWIAVEAPDAPELKYNDEQAIIDSVLKKYAISAAQLRDGNHDDAWVEANDLLDAHGYTDEMQAWMEENKKLHDRTAGLIAEYGRQGDGSGASTIELRPIGAFGAFRIAFGKEQDTEELTQAERQSRIEAGRREAALFTAMLKEKYIASTA